MIPLLYEAANSASQATKALAIASNNMVNATTPGYMADQLFYQPGAAASSFAMVANTQQQHVDVTLAASYETGRDLDVAIGPSGGFIALQSQDERGGERYTRYGHLEINDNGELTSQNLPVLDVNSQVMIIPPHAALAISTEGVVAVVRQEDPSRTLEPLGRIKLLDISPHQLEKDHAGFLQSKADVLLQPLPNSSLQLVPKSLTAANVVLETAVLDAFWMKHTYTLSNKLMKYSEQMMQESSERLL